MGDFILCVDDNDLSISSSSSSSYSLAAASAFCRICHEGEFESCKSLEAPCACSGTMKFAHRDCVLRWCNEKGNTICEICLEKFEPGYIVLPPPKKEQQSIDSPLTIRISVGGIPTNQELQSSVAEEEVELDEFSTAVNINVASYCRSLALIFTILLLLRHVLALLWEGTGDYPFTLLTLLTLRAVGILLPMYILIRMITALQSTIRHPYEVIDLHTVPSSDDDNNVNQLQRQPSV